MAYDVEAIRKKLQKSMSGKFNDPDMFKPEKAQDGSTAIKYRLFILPPLMKGDDAKSGPAIKSMDQFFATHGNHWINDRPHPCPRIFGGDDCPICKFGFDLLRDEKNPDKRRLIVQQWMPQSYYMVNIYFPNVKTNPEDLRGKVRFFNASKTCFDQWTTCLLRDDAGDSDDPEAYGVFFDESKAFCYHIEVLKSGRNNSYKTSKFLPNGGEPTAIIKNKDGSPNEEAIKDVLAKRIDLFTKIEEPDLDKITKLASVMINGDDDDDSGFDEDETAAVATDTAKSDSSVGDDSLEDELEDSSGDSLSEEAPFDTDASADAKKESSDDDTASGDDDTASGDVDANKEIEDLLGQLDDDE